MTYVTGFGDPSMEFWLGLDKLASLTQAGAELLVELETFEVVSKYYRVFSWEIAVKIPSPKTHSEKSNLRFLGKIL